MESSSTLCCLVDSSGVVTPTSSLDLSIAAFSPGSRSKYLPASSDEPLPAFRRRTDSLLATGYPQCARSYMRTLWRHPWSKGLKNLPVTGSRKCGNLRRRHSDPVRVPASLLGRARRCWHDAAAQAQELVVLITNRSWLICSLVVMLIQAKCVCEVHMAICQRGAAVVSHTALCTAYISI
jgi:hypothetical protein